MSDEQKPEAGLLKIEERAGGALYFYSNHVNLAWTAFDINIHFQEFFDDIQQIPMKTDYKIKKHAVATLSWVEAKQLQALLAKSIAAFERVNGDILPVEKFESFSID